MAWTFLYLIETWFCKDLSVLVVFGRLRVWLDLSIRNLTNATRLYSLVLARFFDHIPVAKSSA